jgi:lysosomal Pro-X carboxypeptidase
MWNLAKKFSALIIFAEHRYFGESIPQLQGMERCVSYLSPQEALADYASLCHRLRGGGGAGAGGEWGASGSAIVAFGGSYGGMLASWLRIVYPSAGN